MKIRFVIKLSLILVGIFNLLLAFTSLFSIVVGMLMYAQEDYWSSGLVYQSLFLLLYLFMIFRSDMIVSWMRLDTAFLEKEVTLQADSYAVLLKLLLICIGGWMVVSTVPPLLSDIIYLVDLNNSTDSAQNVVSRETNLLRNLFELILGMLLVLNHARLSRWLESKNQS